MSVTFQGKTLTAMDDPDTHEFAGYYKASPSDGNYYYPNGDGGFTVLTEAQHFDFMTRQRKGEAVVGSRPMTVQEYYGKFASKTAGRKKKRLATKSRPRRSTRSRKVTLRRR